MGQDSEWLTLSRASARLGVHANTLRRWADAGKVPCYRTPGGHRRFRAVDVEVWAARQATPALAVPAEGLVREVVAYTRQQIAARHVSEEMWYAAFAREEERRQMRDMGRRLLGLALKYVSCREGLAPLLDEGRQIGESYGQRCAQRGISLTDTARSFCFFRTSLLQATSPGPVREGVADAEQTRAHTELGGFLDEVMYACLAGYEAACRRLRPPASAA